MSSVTRSSCVDAAAARAAFSRRHACHGPSKKNGFGPAELEHGGGHGLEEPAVVRDEDDRGVERRQLALEPLEALDVEVVRRLVEQQQVGIRRERAPERGARQLAAGERVELPVEVGVAEPEAPQDRRRSVAPGPATCVLEPRLCLAVPAQRRGSVVAARHRLLEPRELLLDGDEVARARERVLPERQALAARRALVVERDPRVLGERELAARQRGLADQGTEERRLARAVRARERQPVAPPQAERDPVEERVAGELLAETGCDQDGHRPKGRRRGASCVCGEPSWVRIDGNRVLIRHGNRLRSSSWAAGSRRHGSRRSTARPAERPSSRSSRPSPTRRTTGRRSRRACFAGRWSATGRSSARSRSTRTTSSSSGSGRRSSGSTRTRTRSSSPAASASRTATLVLATGARPRQLPLPGADLVGVHTYRTLADAEAVIRAGRGRTLRDRDRRELHRRGGRGVAPHARPRRDASSRWARR